MRPSVHHELAAAGEALVAVLALVGSLARVRALVQTEALLHREALGAHVASGKIDDFISSSGSKLQAHGLIILITRV